MELPITNREREICQLIAAGKSNKQVASQLSISYHTVCTHRRNILHKLQAQNTAMALMRMVQNGWLVLES